MLDNLEAEDPNEDGDGLHKLAHGNVEGLRKAVDLSARSLKDMVLQHLVKGGSYALLQASRKNETFNILGVEITDEMKKEAKELQSDFGLPHERTRTRGSYPSTESGQRAPSRREGGTWELPRLRRSRQVLPLRPRGSPKTPNCWADEAH